MPAVSSRPPAKRPKATHDDIVDAGTSSGHPTTAAIKPRARRRPRLFQPFRALGLITNHVPFALTIRHGGKDATKPDINIVACVGTSWTMWDAERMTLLFVGEALENSITSLCIIGGAGGRDSILAASGRAIHRFARGQRIQTYEVTTDESGTNGSAAQHDLSGLSQIITIGDNVLALSASGVWLFVWSLESGEPERRIQLRRTLPDSDESFTATSMLHPSTYVDKVLVGSAEGHLQLYNFRTSTLIHTFERHTLLAYMGVQEGSLDAEDSVAIVDLVQAPALDVVAVVLACGIVLLLNVRYDEPVIFARLNKFSAARGNILSRSSVSFRTDGSAYTMAVGTQVGDIVLFDLEMESGEEHEERTEEMRMARSARLAHTMRAAHDAAVASVQFVQGQPLLITSGADNAIKQWFFESDSVGQDATLGGKAEVGLTSAPRLLKSREGHSAPPRLIRYVGEAGKTIVSAGGEDRSVRSVSVVRDSRSAELSQGALKKKSNQTSRPLISLKLPPTSTISHSSTRSRDWDDLITTHSSVTYAQSWSMRNLRMGAHQLLATSSDKARDAVEATASCVSVCGNFAFVGNAEGYVEMYNIQSGRYRRRFDTREEKVEKVAKRTKAGVVQIREERRRTGGSAVTGIVSDSTNKVVAVSTMKGHLFFFDFSSAAAVGHVDTQAGVSSLILHRATNLAAVLQDDLTVTVYDLETQKKVRVFGGFGAKVLDATFSPDGRWLIATSLDSFVRTFDIPTSRLIDYFYTKEVATSVTFSPLGDFLATTHVASRGIFLWANRNQYLYLALSGIDEDEVLQSTDAEEALPTLRGIDVSELDSEDAGLKELDAGEAEFQRSYTSRPQLFISNDDKEPEGGLVTLSTMPRSRWMTLLNLDVIKARNKPREAPKKPEKAPFFLPVGASSVPDSALNKRGDDFFGDGSTDASEPNGAHSRRLQTLGSQGLDFESDFSRRLAGVLQDDAMDPLFTYLNALPPPALDAEIRTLVRLQDISRFLQCMSRRLQQHREFDAVQAMVAVALRVHADVIVENGVKRGETRDAADSVDEDEDGLELAESLRVLMAEQHRESNRVLDLIQYCMGSLAFVRDIPLA